ncbi:MAG: histidine kinase [Vicinamibacterales bacterium]
MHPLLSRIERIAWYLAAWVAAAFLLSLALSREGLDTLDALVLVLPPAIGYAFVCLSAWYVCRAVPLTSAGAVAVITASIAAALSAGALWYALARGWRSLLEFLSPVQSFAGAAGLELMLLAVAVVVYLLALAACHVVFAYDAAREANAQRLEFQVLTRDAELRALRAQLNPHFLYNSLNSISALTSIDPPGARRMCVLLGDFLRSTLKVSALDRVTVAQELALVDAYLAIEQVRFGARLTLDRNVDDAALTCRVPPLILQPLFENALVHGIAGLLDGGIVRLTLVRRDERLLVRVENPRDPDVAPRRRGGVGLENVTRRLQTAFGDRARFDAVADAGTFRVDLNLPAEEE